MTLKPLSSQISVSEQITENDIASLKEQGFELIICNRPDGEAEGQPSFSAIKTAAKAQGIDAISIAFSGLSINAEAIAEFTALTSSGKKTLAFCRTGTRSCHLWAAAASDKGEGKDAITAAAAQGYDVSKTVAHFTQAATAAPQTNTTEPQAEYDVLIVGAGSGGISVAASLLKRSPDLNIGLIDPAQKHYYQPGWTMVGGGVFSAESTERNMKDLIPAKTTWIQQSVTSFDPESNQITLDNDQKIGYKHLVVSPGLTLNWAGIEGLEETLGKNGVTSNYRYDLAPYTWQLVQGLNKGKAVFTQPAMPIKCAGAPQKALYLSADHWLKNDQLSVIDIHFHNAGGVLFGVADYVPALEEYIEKYGVQKQFNQNLIRVDGLNKTAYFSAKDADGNDITTEQTFDMLHVCPPQIAPEFIAKSPLANEGGWLEVNQYSLQHVRYDNVWGLGDVLNTPNAKTMAAARKQAPVVAHNIVQAFKQAQPDVGYDGYGSCPLTVERGKIVLAEFGYGGKLLPTLPLWLLQGKKPSALAWFLKVRVLPFLYWSGMLKGKELFAQPKSLKSLTD